MKKILRQLAFAFLLISLISCGDGEQKIETIGLKILLVEPLGNADTDLSADFKNLLAPIEHSDSLAFIPHIEVNRIDQVPKLVQKIEIPEASTTEWNKTLGIYALTDAQTDYEENIGELKTGAVLAKPKGMVAWADTVFTNQVDSVLVLSSQNMPFQAAGKTYPTFKDMNTLIAEGIKKNLALGVRKFVIAYKPVVLNSGTPTLPKKVVLEPTPTTVPVEKVTPPAPKPTPKSSGGKAAGNSIKSPKPLVKNNNPTSPIIEQSKPQPPATTVIIVTPPNSSTITTTVPDKKVRDWLNKPREKAKDGEIPKDKNQ